MFPSSASYGGWDMKILTDKQFQYIKSDIESKVRKEYEQEIEENVKKVINSSLRRLSESGWIKTQFDGEMIAEFMESQAFKAKLYQVDMIDNRLRTVEFVSKKFEKFISFFNNL